MEVKVVIRDARDEVDFELTGDLSRRQVDRLRRVAEKVAQGTGWDVVISAEGRR
jgi:hypothetical protein